MVKPAKQVVKREMHPNSLKNLEKRPLWQPGQSGNKEGYSVRARQRDMMYENNPFDGQGRPWGETIAEAGLRQALTKPEAMKDLLNRHEGVPIESHAILQDTTIRFVIGKGYEKDATE
ncbi:hypothetical protein LCGC14_1028750 [marine sediment metagenome]|uniref:DUF5681 domain-containing protein n=1 Tax=marine sediment metagenome TaxID=412755 RepID=A0A0F9NH02_9ZZZZ